MISSRTGIPYGRLESPYKEIFARRLVEDGRFRNWFVGLTPFSQFAPDALLLHQEMLSKRSASAREKGNWAFSHYQERTRCACTGCAGRETDVLAIFQALAGPRFAFHVEVKRPGDRFTGRKDQAPAYPIRAACWVRTAPERVLEHNLASTVLLFSDAQRSEFEPVFVHFPTRISFLEIDRKFPGFFGTYAL